MKAFLFTALLVLSTKVFAQNQLDPIPENFKRIMEVQNFSEFEIKNDGNIKTYYNGSVPGYYDGTLWRNHGTLVFKTTRDQINHFEYTKQINSFLNTIDKRLKDRNLTRNATVTAEFTDGVINGKVNIINNKTGKKIFEGEIVSFINDQGKLESKIKGKASSWDPETGKPLSAKHYDSNGKLFKSTYYVATQGITEIHKWDDELETVRYQATIDKKRVWLRKCQISPFAVLYNEADESIKISFDEKEMSSIKINEILNTSIFPQLKESSVIKSAMIDVGPTEFIDQEKNCSQVMNEFKRIFQAEIVETKENFVGKCNILINSCDRTSGACEDSIKKAQEDVNSLLVAIAVEEIHYKQNPILYGLYDLFVKTDADRAEKILATADYKLKQLQANNKLYQDLRAEAQKLKEDYENTFNQCTQSIEDNRFLTQKDINNLNELGKSKVALDYQYEEFKIKAKKSNVTFE